MLGLWAIFWQGRAHTPSNTQKPLVLPNFQPDLFSYKPPNTKLFGTNKDSYYGYDPFLLALDSNFVIVFQFWSDFGPILSQMTPLHPL